MTILDTKSTPDLDRVPNELLNMIAIQLRLAGKLRSLANFGMVSKRYLSFAVEHLYYEPQLGNAKTYENLPSIPNFARTIIDRPDLAKTINRIDLTVRTGRRHEIDTALQQTIRLGVSAIAKHFDSKILPCLPNPTWESLALRGWESILVRVVLAHLPNLKHLSIFIASAVNTGPRYSTVPSSVLKHFGGPKDPENCPGLSRLESVKSRGFLPPFIFFIPTIKIAQMDLDNHFYTEVVMDYWMPNQLLNWAGTCPGYVNLTKLVLNIECSVIARAEPEPEDTDNFDETEHYEIRRTYAYLILLTPKLVNLECLAVKVEYDQLVVPSRVISCRVLMMMLRGKSSSLKIEFKDICSDSALMFDKAEPLRTFHRLPDLRHVQLPERALTTNGNFQPYEKLFASIETLEITDATAASRLIADFIVARYYNCSNMKKVVLKRKRAVTWNQEAEAAWREVTRLDILVYGY